MTTPQSSDEWAAALVAALAAAPAGRWPAVVAEYAVGDRVRDAVETAAALAAEYARKAATPADAAVWVAVLDGLAAAYSAHASGVRRLASLMGGVGGRSAAPAAPPPARELQPGGRLGPFTVTRFLAAGGMGAVYEAVQDDLARTVALKVVRHAAASPLTRARFARERLVLARLHQSNIVPVFYAGEADGLQFYAMQYVAGAPLHRVVSAVQQRAGTAPGTALTPALSTVAGELRDAAAAPPTASAATQVATRPGPAGRAAEPGAPPVRLSAAYFASAAAALAQVAEAIHHGHEKGVIHRDIKPSNLIVDGRGGCWVIDYGLARAAGGGAAAPAPDPDLDAAVTHGWVGTPQYMAPEQFDGHADARSDVWGLGATLYELLALRPAFAADGWKAVQDRVRTADPPAVSITVTNAPADLEAVARKALAKTPADRYESAAAFAADLRRWLNWEPTAARPGWKTLRPARLWAWRNKGWAAALVLVLAGLGAAAAVATAQAEQRERELDQRRREQEHTALLVKAEEVRHALPITGWADDLRTKLRNARAIRPDADLRDYFLAAHLGPDAKVVLRHDVEVKSADRVTGWAGAAFGPGGRLLVGGSRWERKDRIDRTPALVFDADLVRAPTPSAKPGLGPVAFADADTPLQLVLPTGDDRTMVLWNLATNTAVAAVPLPAGPKLVGQVVAALSPDGRRVAAAVSGPFMTEPAEGVTAVWDVDPTKPGAPPARAGAWPRAAVALAFSPDGRHLAAGDSDGLVTVHAPDGTERFRLPTVRVPVYSLAFGRRFVADATGAAPPPADRPDWLLAVGTNTGSTPVFDLARGQLLNTCRGGSDYTNALAFTPDGTGLVTVGNARALLWDVATGRPVFEFRHRRQGDYTGYLTGAAVSPDGRRVALTGMNTNTPDAAVTVTEFDPDRGVRLYRGLAGQVQRVWVSPTAKWVVGLSGDWHLAAWDRATGRLAYAWSLTPGWTSDNAAVAVDEAAGAVYFASGTRAVRLNLATGRRDQAWALPLGQLDTLAVAADGRPRLVRREFTGPIEYGKPRPPAVFRCRDLNPDGTAPIRYEFTPERPGRHAWLTAGGRVLAVNVPIDGGDEQHLFDADTGAPFAPLPTLPFRGAKILGLSADRARVLVGRGTRAETYALPGMTPTGEYPHPPTNYGEPDDAHRLLVVFGEFDGRPGSALFRLGETRPFCVLDLGQESLGGGITADGRYGFWGRRDGSVAVADVARCAALAAEYGRR